MHSVGDQQFFRAGLFDALTAEPKDPEQFDLGTTVQLARPFAQEGDSEIKKAMYDAVARAGFAREGHCCDDLIKLDGIDALHFAADLFPCDIDDNDLWQVGSLVFALQERDGAEPANEAIQRASRESPRLARMLETARASDLKREGRLFKPSTRLDYPALKQLIGEPGVKSYLFFWSRAASIEELEAVANDLTTETDEGRILAYLSIFRERQCPLPANRLLELAEHSDIRIARRAVDLLSRLKDPAIRSLALSFLDVSDRAGDAADLLASNYQTGDFQLIEARLREPMDAEDLHHFGMGIKHLLETYCPKEAEQSLLLLYENGPCSLCRHKFVERLIELQRLPDRIRSECHFDAYTETRKLVQ